MAIPGTLQSPPPQTVRTAFYAPDLAPSLLPGGQGRTWRIGDLVLKPVDDRAEHDWVSTVFDSWTAHDVVRVPQPLRSREGRWAYDGWGAHHWVDGDDVLVADRPELVRKVSDDFHAAVRTLERPAFLDDRADPWSFGDRVAWEGLEPQGHGPTVALIQEGLSALRPAASSEQVVHGDIGGNILCATGRPPAVIDWPPYFRPVGWALAVAAGDAICWGGAPFTLLDDWADVPEWDQMLLRALIYRIATRGRSEALGTNDSASEQYVRQRRPSLMAVLSRLNRGDADA